jgi:hypothetical protein
MKYGANQTEPELELYSLNGYQSMDVGLTDSTGRKFSDDITN